jgi:hypothetical protein
MISAPPLATRKLVGPMVHAVGKTDPSDGFLRQLPPFGGPDPSVDERQLHVVEHIRSGQQVKCLEDKPDLFIPDFRQLVLA